MSFVYNIINRSLH